MTKKQKIWLAVFLGMFLIPEMIWGSVTNLLYEFFQNTNKAHPYRGINLLGPDNYFYLSSVLFVQFLGVFLASISIYRVDKSKRVLKSAGFFISILVSFLVLALFYLSVTLGRHGIG